jgi:hypothetical protein
MTNRYELSMFKRLSLLACVFFFLTGMIPTPACQDEKPPAIKVTLVVILASEEGNTVDSRLKAIAEEVQKRDCKLKSFCLKNMQCKSLKPHEKSSWNLIDEWQVQIVIKNCVNKDNRVNLAVSLPSMGEIEYETVCGKFLPIVTRCCTKNRERLILAIRVQPCRGD